MLQGIPVAQSSGKSWSTDENILHCSYEAGQLEDPGAPMPEGMCHVVKDVTATPDVPLELRIEVCHGVVRKLQGH